MSIAYVIVDDSLVLDTLDKRLRTPRQALQEIGNFLVKQARESFDRQGRNGVRWIARKVPNIMGIIEDLKRGPTIKSSRFAGRPALVDSGGLKNTLRVRTTSDTVTVASLKSYADLHQRGGKSSIEVTPAVRKNLKEPLRRRPELRPELGFIFRRSQVSTDVPARPFLTLGKEDQPGIEEIIARYVQRPPKREEGRGKKVDGPR